MTRHHRAPLLYTHAPPFGARRLGLALVGAATVVTSLGGAFTAQAADVAPARSSFVPVEPGEVLVAVPFPSGVWRGVAVISGGITADGVDVHATAPAKLTFEVEIGVDGSIVIGSWALTGGEMEVVVPGGEGAFSLSGAGQLLGNDLRLELAGEVGLVGSATVNGQTYPVELAVPSAGAFSATGASCSVVTGDIAVEIRQEQEAAGLGTTVTGPFTAQRIAEPGQALGASVEDGFLGLVFDVTRLWNNTDYGITVTRQDILDVAARSEAFYNKLWELGGCTPLPSYLGEAPEGGFARLLADLLRRELKRNDLGFTASDLYAIGRAARSAGIFGSYLPDAEVLTLEGRLHSKFVQSINEARASDNDAECVVLLDAVTDLGFNDLIPSASECVSGGISA